MSDEKVTLTGTLVRACLRTADALEVGEYLCTPGKMKFERTVVLCPYCRRGLYRSASRSPSQPYGRVVRIEGEPKAGKQMVIHEPVPKDIIVLSCSRCDNARFALTRSRFAQEQRARNQRPSPTTVPRLTRSPR